MKNDKPKDETNQSQDGARTTDPNSETVTVVTTTTTTTTTTRPTSTPQQEEPTDVIKPGGSMPQGK